MFAKTREFPTPGANAGVKRTRTKLSKGTTDRTLDASREGRLIPELENEIPFSSLYVSRPLPRVVIGNQCDINKRTPVPYFWKLPHREFKYSWSSHRVDDYEIRNIKKIGFALRLDTKQSYSCSYIHNCRPPPRMKRHLYSWRRHGADLMTATRRPITSR